MTPEERAKIILRDLDGHATLAEARQFVADAIRAAVEEEREACARLVEEMCGPRFERCPAACEIWQAIRARKP